MWSWPQDSKEHDLPRVWSYDRKVLLGPERLRRSKTDCPDGNLLWHQGARTEKNQIDGRNRGDQPAHNRTCPNLRLRHLIQTKTRKPVRFAGHCSCHVPAVTQLVTVETVVVTVLVAFAIIATIQLTVAQS